MLRCVDLQLKEGMASMMAERPELIRLLLRGPSGVCLRINPRNP
jgi:hypothetical protein